jgi:molecular chaperone GrpE
MGENKRDISVITGIFIQNEKGEIWFGRMPKWSDKLAIPGGHLDRGETLDAGAKRELLEETGLIAESLEYLGYYETIDPVEYTTPKHFLAFNYRYHVTGRPEITFNEEFSEEVWLTKEDALARDDINSLTRTTLGALDKTEKQITKEVEVEVEVNVDFKDKWLRAQADYSNLIKETAEKRSQWASMSEWQILEEFIPVYDNFKKAFSGVPESDDKQWKNWAQGIEYIKKQFADILKAHAIEEIETVGKVFDPAQHECLDEEHAEDVEDNVIVREVGAGYKKGEKILQVAKVVVNRKT